MTSGSHPNFRTCESHSFVRARPHTYGNLGQPDRRWFGNGVLGNLNFQPNANPSSRGTKFELFRYQTRGGLRRAVR